MSGNSSKNSPVGAGVQSVEIGMRVIEHFVSATGPQPLRDVSKGTGLGPSAAHRYVVSFVRSGMLVQLADQRYELGPLATRLGFAALSRIDALQVAIAALDRFVSETGATAMLSVWSERGPLVVRWIQGTNPVYTTIAVGSVLPVLKSATGQIFLAWRGDAAVFALAGAKTKALAQAKVVRAAGYADISGDLVPGLNAVSVPVLDGTGALVAAITAVAAGTDINAATRQALIVSTGNASAALGYRKP